MNEQDIKNFNDGVEAMYDAVLNVIKNTNTEGKHKEICNRIFDGVFSRKMHILKNKSHGESNHHI